MQSALHKHSSAVAENVARDFRYNNRKALGVEDSERAEKLLAGFRGKRLTYQTTAG